MKKFHIWTVVLAAGASSRFNGVKALQEWQGGTFLSHILSAATDFSGENVVVVTGAHRDQIKILSGHEAHNAEWQKGMGTSIACSFEKVLQLDDDANAVLVMTVDQPFVDAAHLENLYDKFQQSGKCVLTSNGDFDGPPAIISRDYFAKAVQLNGDKGIKSFLQKYETVRNDEASCDIDTQDDLKAISKSIL